MVYLKGLSEWKEMTSHKMVEEFIRAPEKRKLHILKGVGTALDTYLKQKEALFSLLGDKYKYAGLYVRREELDCSKCQD